MTVDTADREQLQRDYLAAWNARDAERIASFFAAGAIYDDRGAGEVAHGPDGIRAHAAACTPPSPTSSFELVRAAHGEDFTRGGVALADDPHRELDGLAAERAGSWRAPASTSRHSTARAGSPTWSATTTAPRSCATSACCPRAAPAPSALWRDSPRCPARACAALIGRCALAPAARC